MNDRLDIISRLVNSYMIGELVQWRISKQLVQWWDFVLDLWMNEDGFINRSWQTGVVESRWDVTGILFESTCDWLSIETVRSSPRDLWGSHSLISYGGFRSTNPQFLFKTRLHSLINEFTRSEFENRSWYSSQLFTIIFKSVSSNMDTCFWIDSNASDCSEGEKEIIDGTLRKRAC